jgi:uncharacterized protein involved in exopolysaccharide biosynthesis
MERTADTLDLVDLWSALKAGRWLILSTAILGLVVGALIAFLSTPKYRSTVLMTPVHREAAAGVLGALASQLGPLANLAGLNISAAGGTKELALATLTSRGFLESWISERGILPVLFAGRWDSSEKRWTTSDPEDVPSLEDGYRKLTRKVLRIEDDKERAVVMLSVDWVDRKLAAEWANQLADRLNQTLREKAIQEGDRSIKFLNDELSRTTLVELRQAIYRLVESQEQEIMLAHVREDYAFRIIDRARVSDADRFVRPNRPLVILLGLLAGLTVGAVIVAMRRMLTHPDR